MDLNKSDDISIALQLSIYLNQLAEKDLFSGAVLFARDGRPIFQQAYGYANRSFSVPNCTSTKFNLGSMNKMFTALAVTQLAEKGKLSFDDKVGKHLPDFSNPEVREKVSLHQLLTHTSGMGCFFTEEFESASKTRFRQVRDYFPLFENQPLQFEPGTRWMYSNAGFILLGAVIEAVSKENYFNYLRQHIFEPTGMPDTDSYDMDQVIPNLAVGYTLNGALPEQIHNNYFLHSIKGSPAGGGFSTLMDLLKFEQALRNHQLLSPEFTEILLSPKQETDRPGARYAYGFFVYNLEEETITGHGGGFPGINAVFEMHRNSGYCVIILANCDPPAAQAVNARLSRWINNIPLPQAADISLKALKRYEGKYLPDIEPVLGPMTLYLIEDSLYLSHPLTGTRKILPLSEVKFIDDETFKLEIYFHFGKQETIEWIEIKSSGSPIKAYRMGKLAADNPMS